MKLNEKSKKELNKSSRIIWRTTVVVMLTALAVNLIKGTEVLDTIVYSLGIGVIYYFAMIVVNAFLFVFSGKYRG